MLGSQDVPGTIDGGVGRMRPERLEEKAIWRPLEGGEGREALTVNTIKGHGCAGSRVGGSQ